MGGAPKMAKTVELAACFAMVDLSTIGAKACKVGASDGPTSSPHAHHILQTSVVRPSLGLHSASFTKFTIQFIFLWLQFQVREHVRFQ